MIQYEVLTDLIDIKTSDKKTLLHDLVEMFIAKTPHRLIELNTAISNKDKNQIALIAHTLKASCAYLGLAEMTSLCIELEKIGQAKEPFNAKTTQVWMSALEESYDEAVAELNGYILKVFH